MNTSYLPIRGFAFVCLLALLGGCATASKPQVDPRAVALPGTRADNSIRVDTEDARVAQLWSAAEQARIDRNDNRALDLLVQALEISPQNGLLWSRAAELQLNTQQAVLAENYALKSNLYADDDAKLLHRNWLIIEHARGMRGDLLGVRSAHKMVQQYQYQ
ncbi:MAG: hypothetical protein ACR2PS_09195 [Pseudomonadales bacterium]